MNAAQKKFFNMVALSASDARAGLHDVAWTVLGLLMIGAIVALGLLAIWLLRGGLSNYCSLFRSEGRQAFEHWLRES